MVDISERIDGIRSTATTDGDYTGKKITELPDMVINSAQELKQRFDAAVIEVLDPKYRENVAQVADALSELTEQTNKELDEKSDGDHTHGADELTGILPLKNGGTGGETAAAARKNLGAISLEDCNDEIDEHNDSAQAHSALFAAKADKSHTHTSGDIIGLATDNELAALEDRVSEIEELGGIEADTSTAGCRPKLWFGTSTGGATYVHVTTSSGDFQLKEGNMVLVHFTGSTAQGSGSGYVHIDGQGVNLYDISENESFAISANSLVLFIVVKADQNGTEGLYLARFAYQGESL